jgi:hypothetical protein
MGTHRDLIGKIQSLAFGSGLCFAHLLWAELCLKK